MDWRACSIGGAVADTAGLIGAPPAKKGLMRAAAPSSLGKCSGAASGGARAAELGVVPKIGCLWPIPMEASIKSCAGRVAPTGVGAVVARSAPWEKAAADVVD